MTRILIADSDPRTRQALALLLERKLGVHCTDEAWIAPRWNASWQRALRT